MSIRVSAFTIDVGFEQQLEIAQGEDREFRPTFQDGGAVLDMTGAQEIVLSVKSRTTGQEVFARAYSGFQGTGAEGTPRFQVLAADTAGLQDGPYDADIYYVDSGGYRWQVLVLSTFLVLKSAGFTTDDVTTPAAVPVVYGLNWLAGWSTVGTGYQVNDSVWAYDGSLGSTGISTFRAIAVGVTYYPLNQSLLTPATGWAYVGQHGGVGGGGGGGGGAGGGFTAYAGASTFPGASSVLNAGFFFIDTVDKILYFPASGAAGSATYWPLGAYQ